MAGEKQFVTGENIDAKFAKINKVLNRLSKRAATVIGTIVMPQIPITGGVQNPDADGVLQRFLLPVAGMIKTAYFYAEMVNSKTKPVLTITLIHEGSTKSSTLTYKQGLNKLTPNLQIEAGTCLVLSTTKAENVSGLAVGLVFEVAMSATAKEQVALSAHLDAVEADDAGETTKGKAE